MSMNVDIRDLLDDDAFDPEKLFNEKEYSTIIVGKDGFSKKEESLNAKIARLADDDATRAEKEDIFRALQEAGAQALLISAIQKAPVAQRAALAAACWESGLDFSTDFLFFAGLSVNADYALAMEAVTVMMECASVPEEALGQAALLLQKSPADAPLRNEALQVVNAKLNHGQ